MLLLSLILATQQDFVERRVENASLILSLQQKNLVGHFAIDNNGDVAYHYNTHISRYRLSTHEAKADAEAILFRLLGNRVTIRTTSQFAHATNGYSLRGYFQNFVGVDDWSNVWFSYSSLPAEPSASGMGRHLALLQIDQRGKNPNKSRDFPDPAISAYYGPKRSVHAIVEVGHLKYRVVSYKVNGGKLVRLVSHNLPNGVRAITYDPYTRRCVAEGKDKAVIIHVPSGAMRELPKLGDYPKYTMTRGRAYCQSGSTLYVDNGNRWEVYRPDTLLVASNNGKHWLLYRSGQVILRTYED